MSLIPVPAGRSSDALLSSRLLNQVQVTQQELLRIQSQLSTGSRLLTPSDDAPAAIRAIDLQRLLERKDQVQVNLNTTKSYIAATDTSLSSVFDQLANVRATALGAIDTVGGDLNRETAIDEVNRALESLLATANEQFRGRYLYAGSANTQPFVLDGNVVRYQGNEGSLSSYADLDHLLASNVNGHEVFGGFSGNAVGSVDLNPVLSTSTKLANLHGGEGVSKGSFTISDGTLTSTVDISSAETLGDVIRLIEANPPEGRELTARVTATGLEITLDAAGGGNLTIREVGQGTTAFELGIKNTAGVGTAPLVGDDLDPALTVTTRLADVLGVRASAVVDGTGSNNGLVFEYAQRGAAGNNITIQFVDDAGVTKGGETVDYDDSTPSAPVLTIHIDAGNTNANDVIAAIENDLTAAALFNVRLDGQDTTASSSAGTGTIDVTASGTTAGGSGIEFDQSSGLEITSGGETFTLDISDAVTVGDLLNKFNASPGGLKAEISGSSLLVRSTLSGADFSIGESGGSTASELGLRTFTADTYLADLNYGGGIGVADGTDFIITRRDGTELEIDVSTATTVGDVIDLINNAPGNADPSTRVVASLATVGNGIVLTDSNSLPTTDLSIRRGTGSEAAYGLGLIAYGENSTTATGSPQTIAGEDVNAQEVQGVFNSLLRLREALESEDNGGVERAVALLDLDIERLGYVRAEVGSRGQTIDSLEERLAIEKVELQGVLSKEVDVDLVEAISNLTNIQAALEAALRTIGSTYNLSLLEYL